MAAQPVHETARAGRNFLFFYVGFSYFSLYDSSPIHPSISQNLTVGHMYEN